MTRVVKKKYFVMRISDKKWLTQPNYYHVTWRQFEEFLNNGEYTSEEIELGTVEAKSKLKKVKHKDPRQTKLGGLDHADKNSKGVG